MKDEHDAKTDLQCEYEQFKDEARSIEMRGIARKDSTSSVYGRCSLFKFAEDCLAQSLLIFLIADLRLLSATGRVYTKFETISVDSDETKKSTAADLIGISPLANNNPSMKKKTKGLSPAQIMAILIVELRKEMKQQRNLESDDLRNQHKNMEESFISTLIDPERKAHIEEDMHTLLKAYNEMIARDLNTQAPTVTSVIRPQVFMRQMSKAKLNVEKLAKNLFTLTPTPKQDGDANRENVDHQSSQDDDTSSKSLGTPERTVLNKKLLENMGYSNLDLQNLAKSLFAPTYKQDADTNTENCEDDTRSSKESQPNRRKRRSMMSFSKANGLSLANLKKFREQEITLQRFEEVGNTLFQLGLDPGGGVTENIIMDETNRILSEDELIDMMEAAVESRIISNTDFMSSFFKEGSVSHVLALSKARIVWVNDWYPLKDLTYAISVDKESKSVMVVFRGAITRADWGHALNGRRVTVPNPIEDEFKNKEMLTFHRGFYRYLFRKRKDTGTTKYDEIAAKVHFYGMQEIGPDYRVVVTGLSLGGALSTLFGFFASTEDIFTKNGHVTVITFGSPMVGGRAFADSFRHQEKIDKLRYARFFNENDVFAHLPFNLIPSKKGSNFQHVGMAIYLPCHQNCNNCCHNTCPRIYLSHAEDETFIQSYSRALKNNVLFNMPLPWKLRRFHTLDEHLERMLYGEKEFISEGSGNLLEKSLEEIYLILMRKSAAVNVKNVVYC